MALTQVHAPVVRDFGASPPGVPSPWPNGSPPTVSVVTPSLNQGAFLEATLRSVLDQGYPALELIVQDGGSSDGTTDILERYRTRLCAVESMPDGGQANGINRGFARSRGEILAWLNSDDLHLPWTVATVARYFAEHPKVDVVYGHRILIDADGAEVGRWVLPPHSAQMLRWEDHVPQETLFFRRSIWTAIGGALDESFDYALDWDLLLRFQEAGAKIVRLPRFLGAFRVHDAQKTTRMLAVGLREMARLRQRCHGRPVGGIEVHIAMLSYRARARLLRVLHRVGLLRC